MKLLTFLRRNFACKLFVDQVDYHCSARACVPTPTRGFAIWYWSYLLISLFSGFLRLLLIAYWDFYRQEIDLLFATLYHTNDDNNEQKVDRIFILVETIYIASPTIHFYLLFHAPFEYGWERLHQLVVQNWRQFWHLNRDYLRTKFVLNNASAMGYESFSRHPLATGKMLAKAFRYIWKFSENSGIRVNYPKGHYPNLASRIRAQTVCVVTVVHAVQLLAAISSGK